MQNNQEMSVDSVIQGFIISSFENISIIHNGKYHSAKDESTHSIALLIIFALFFEEKVKEKFSIDLPKHKVTIREFDSDSVPLNRAIADIFLTLMQNTDTIVTYKNGKRKIDHEKFRGILENTPAFHGLLTDIVSECNAKNQKQQSGWSCNLI